MADDPPPLNPPLFEIASPGNEEHQTQITAITLRDLFAAAAVMGLGADAGYQRESTLLADRAFDIADAMLKRRVRRGR